MVSRDANNENSASSVGKNSKLEPALKYVISNLESARFLPIRTGWTHDYGFDDGGTLNSFEYIRSLMTYEEFQGKSREKIFLKGPHTSTNLNLKSQSSFGHYNPKFVKQLHANLNRVLSSEAFVYLTRPSVEEFNILRKLRGYIEIYSFIGKNKAEFDQLKSEYIEFLNKNEGPPYDYRQKLPTYLRENLYNWSETDYYFWVRRDIDGTKELWNQIIIDFIEAYES
jgi:hypothetical protein